MLTNSAKKLTGVSPCVVQTCTPALFPNFNLPVTIPPHLQSASPRTKWSLPAETPSRAITSTRSSGSIMKAGTASSWGWNGRRDWKYKHNAQLIGTVEWNRIYFKHGTSKNLPLEGWDDNTQGHETVVVVMDHCCLAATCGSSSIIPCYCMWSLEIGHWDKMLTPGLVRLIV